MNTNKKNETSSDAPKSPLTLSKQTVRVMSVKTDLRAGEIAACSSCPSRISSPSNSVLV
jgi:hypothetical protein